MIEKLDMMIERYRRFDLSMLAAALILPTELGGPHAVSGGNEMPSDSAQSAAELRTRAARYRKHAWAISNVELQRRVLDLADELDARADALEGH